MIAAVIFGSIGLIATLVGVQCSKAAGKDMVRKGRIVGVGGVLFILQGNWACSSLLELLLLCVTTAKSQFVHN